MINAHWFDTLGKELSRAGTRRATFQTAIALTAGHVFGDARSAAGKQSKRKQKKHGNGKKHKPKKGKDKECEKNYKGQPCSRGACAFEPAWAGNQCELNHCEFICRQCDGDNPREFCIVDGKKPDGTPTKVARCCMEGEACCDGHCFKPTPGGEEACCDGKWTNLAHDHKHCGACGNPCTFYEECILGQCMLCETCEPSCDSGSSLCAGDPTGCCFDDPDFRCCPNGCRNIAFDDDNCGFCGNFCPTPQQCINNRCVCDPDDSQKHCPEDQLCIPKDQSCCNRLGSGCPPGYECCGSERNQCCPI